MGRFVLLLSILHVGGAVDVLFSPGAGLDTSAYEGLGTALTKKLVHASEVSQLCIGHSVDGAHALLDAVNNGQSTCDGGVVLLGAAPLPDNHSSLRHPVLVVAGDLDGYVPFSHFAVARHRAKGLKGRHFAVIVGASHMSFASGKPSEVVAETDLEADLPDEAAFARIADIVHDFVKGGGEHLTAAEEAASQLADPIVKALEQEGSTALGKVACNSDWPTNPTCQYPKWPDHSAPFGPAPAPSPALPSDCICGSPWIMKTAGTMAYDIPGPYSSFTNDAFHDVADVHPFHLPHIFNSCHYTDSSCLLNVTTVTMPVQKAGDVWPSGKSAPLSAFEFKTKFKSREAIRAHVGDPTASGDLDKVNDMCRSINQAAFDWALSNAESSVRSRFKSSGEPMVMVDDVEATIGITGPEWIKDELVYKRVSDSKSPTGSRIEVQSWKFVVGNTGNGSLPWFFPVGMHYCKLLSPARAMEWIYTDSRRSALARNIVV